jgi:hypothetical protein
MTRRSASGRPGVRSNARCGCVGLALLDAVERHIYSDISARRLYRSVVRGEPAVGAPDRQRATLTKIAIAASRTTWVEALLVVGSLADDSADALSDIDLLVVVREGGFEQAWAERETLRVTGTLCAWDQRLDQDAEVAAHRWLTPELVLVEALIATPSSGVRLAEPWELVVGRSDTPAGLTRRPPIARSEMDPTTQPHPVEAAYDEFKSGVRRACS